MLQMNGHPRGTFDEAGPIAGAEGHIRIASRKSASI